MLYRFFATAGIITVLILIAIVPLFFISIFDEDEKRARKFTKISTITFLVLLIFWVISGFCYMMYQIWFR